MLFGSFGLFFDRISSCGICCFFVGEAFRLPWDYERSCHCEPVRRLVWQSPPVGQNIQEIATVAYAPSQ